MNLRWSSRARANSSRIFSFIASDNPRAAIKIDRIIEDAVDSLVEFPNMGRSGRRPGTREWPIPGTTYIVIYRTTGDNLIILRLLHTAQCWP